MIMNIPSKLKLHLATFRNAAMTSYPISVHSDRALKENVTLCWWPKICCVMQQGKTADGNC